MSVWPANQAGLRSANLDRQNFRKTRSRLAPGYATAYFSGARATACASSFCHRLIAIFHGQGPPLHGRTSYRTRSVWIRLGAIGSRFNGEACITRIARQSMGQKCCRKITVTSTRRRFTGECQYAVHRAFDVATRSCWNGWRRDVSDRIDSSAVARSV